MLAGRYRLDAELGRGSMGTVWDAYDTVLHRRVAIKQVHLPQGMPAAEMQQISRRTLREARAVAGLSHPHVITLYDILTLDTGPVIVMELMAARTLADLLEQDGRLDDAAAAVVGRAVADGLLAAHQGGITHRDVKPANVLIGDDGRIKLTDFGIARSVTEQTMTATGMVLGSPAYISPEVAAGRPAGPAADAWGLGALLFAAVEGRPPYDRGAPIATMTAVVNDPVPPHPHAGRLGPIIDALLVKEPSRRMPLPRVLAILTQLAGNTTLPAPTAVPPGPRGGREAVQRPDAAPREGPLRSLAPGAVPAAAAATTPSTPPPPWAQADAANLPALPARSAPRRQGLVLALALAVGILAAVGGFVGVWYVAGLA